ncbi:hypothetical protein HOLleu_10401 [Holothuria leucospilota]|uniref:Uncharacterized protein n=1 Tax=Holothuria leucospilota TaxID=206669 RepID=A0A9Q1HFP3_HOLLE|nr:hypothetical protein HOLleu_10401 [Holothuria leucospilota]
MADSREEVHDITGNNPYLRILNDFSDYIQILKHSPEVVAFKEKTGLRPAVRILEITIYDTDFQFVHFTWGRGGEISSLEHWGKDVEEFGGHLRTRTDEWYRDYLHTTLQPLLEGLHQRGMDLIFRFDILFFHC